MFVRHAEPDYAIDSITPKGRMEAELLSQRLCKLDVKDFFCSPMGRARDTASYTLDKLGRKAEILPWLAEYRGRIIDPQTGRGRLPWDFMPRYWTGSKALYDIDQWLDTPLMSSGTAAEIYRESINEFDSLLARYGYERDGPVYRCACNKPDTLVFFCHFGISMALFSHLCGISPVALWQCFCAQPSSITTVITEERVKGEVFFRCMQMGDISHLYAADENWSTAGLFPECYTGIDSTDPNDPRFKK